MFHPHSAAAIKHKFFRKMNHTFMKSNAPLLFAASLLVFAGCAGTSSSGPMPAPTAETQHYRDVSTQVGLTLAQLPKLATAAEPPMVLVAPLVNRSGREADGALYTRILRERCASSARGKARFMDHDQWEKAKQEGAASGKNLAYDYLLTAEWLTGVVDGAPGQDTTVRVSFKLLERSTTLLLWTETYELP
jgi:hypothetical protein